MMRMSHATRCAPLAGTKRAAHNGNPAPEASGPDRATNQKEIINIATASEKLRKLRNSSELADVLNFQDGVGGIRL